MSRDRCPDRCGRFLPIWLDICRDRARRDADVMTLTAGARPVSHAPEEHRAEAVARAQARLAARLAPQESPDHYVFTRAETVEGESEGQP